ncbi:MAG: glycosyltransferase, partial [Eubacteriaceae bacterium]|nr:glycosyltransferase [Eubacteriaceae bacterium]
MDKLMVSIIIPAKNEEAIIEKVLLSLNIAIDTYGKSCEIILVDNGSTDATCKIASEYSCRVMVKPNVSIATLRNLGAQQAQGELLGFLDADCLVDPRWIQYCDETLSDHCIGVVGTRAIPDLNNSTWVEEGWYGLVSGAARPDYPNWIGSSNMFMRKDVFVDVGGFDEELVTAEDVNLCNKIIKKYRVCLDKRINTIHLRESKTISQLVKREIWRGKSSIRQFIISEDKIGAFKSIVIPLVMDILSILTMFGIILNNMLKWSYVLIFFAPLI